LDNVAAKQWAVSGRDGPNANSLLLSVAEYE